jgi:hypothetical protein
MSRKELSEMSALDLMAWTMEIREAEFLDEQYGSPKRFEWETEPVHEKPAAELLRVVLGEIQESRDVTHVVFRRILREPDTAYLLEPIGCATFRKVADGWRAALSKHASAKAGVGRGPWSALAALRSTWL